MHSRTLVFSSSAELGFRPLLPPDTFDGPPIWWGRTLECGGVERQLLANAKSFAAQGAKLHLLCDSLCPGTGEVFFLPEARQYFKRVYALGDILPEKQKHSLSIEEIAAVIPDFSPAFYPYVARYVSVFTRLRPRMVHAWNADLFYVVLAALLAGVPRIIVGGRSLAPRSRYPFGFESAPDNMAYRVLHFAMRHPSVVMTNNSSAGCADYADWLGLSSEKIFLTPNILHGEQWRAPEAREVRQLRQSLGIPERAPVIGGLFRFSTIKNPALWVHAAGLVLNRHPEAYAVLGGGGGLWNETKRIVSDSLLAGRLVLPGPIQVTSAFYHMCSAFLLTSHVEGLPNVVLEAQYSGLPVVSTQAGGVVDIIQDKVSGFIVPDADAGALAARLIYILKNPSWGKTAGRNGHEFVTRAFSEENSFRKLAELYDSIGVSLT